MLHRREFLGVIAAPAFTAPALKAGALWGEPAIGPRPVIGEPEEVAHNEEYWSDIQRAFMVDRSVVNLNNGGVSPSPAAAHEALKRRLDLANTQPTSHVLWTLQHPQWETVRERLARQWGVDAEEVALTRNASESLQTCQLGLPLKAGDEVLTTTQDYPRMITAFRQRERRDGIVLRQVRLPVPCEDNDAVVRAFEEAITERTRLILVSHVVFMTGQILPVREIVSAARRWNGGVPVVVDGAHALAQFDFRISDLRCDFYATSLHKWLHVPVGVGLLYIRRERIRDVWPLMAASPEMDENIRKFEETGTHPEAMALSAAESLTFHQAIGGARKEARLRYLRDRWARRLLDSGRGRVKLNTSLKPQYSCAIANMAVDGLNPAQLQKWLWGTRRILTTAIEHEECTGIRVTPSTYTTLEEIDRFCEAVEWAIEHGLPDAGS